MTPASSGSRSNMLRRPAESACALQRFRCPKFPDAFGEAIVSS
jgi:hypothetical protein